MQRMPDDSPWQSPTPYRRVEREFLGEVAQEFGLTAYDDAVVRGLLHDWSDDDLKQITLVPHGATLERGAVYLDLLHPERGEFTALGSEIVEPDQRIVARDTTDYELWARLLEWAAHQ
jgi:hypothetical protein